MNNTIVLGTTLITFIKILIFFLTFFTCFYYLMPFASYLQTYVNLYSKLKYSAIEVHINKSSWCGKYKREEGLT